MQLAVCQICKYPVWSYICPDCLSGEIVQWLPEKLSRGFREFNRLFLAHFSSIESNLTQTTCIHCHNEKETTLCSFCYIAEAFQWLHERDRKLARTLFMTLPTNSSFKIADGSTQSQNEIPVSYAESGTDESAGICEDCGAHVEETRLANGKWICESCMDCE
jgi:hypothetical protein